MKSCLTLWLFAVSLVATHFILTSPCAAQVATSHAVTGSKVTANLKFEITAEKTQLLVLDVLLPRTQTGRQQVLAIHYSVQPNTVYEKHGQQYAQFQLTKFPAELTVNLQAEVYRYDLTTARTAPLKTVETKETLAQWLIYEQYLEKDNANIQAAARTLSGKDDEARARACFEHTLKTLKKTPYTDKDIGAMRAFHDRTGDCTEFADVFIALCRAKGVPARICQGYLLEPVDDTPKHDWAEVHLAQYGWVPFDPLYVHLGKKTTFSDLRPIYLPIERQRRNAALNFNHFWGFRYEGDGPVKVKDTFTVTSRVDLQGK